VRENVDLLTKCSLLNFGRVVALVSWNRSKTEEVCIGRGCIERVREEKKIM
jgi:hypothetical protein